MERSSNSAPARGRLRRMGWISRGMLRVNPTALFVFGDNMAGVGYGGQAKEMRGEPNAVGIPTKWAPGWQQEHFFCSGDLWNLSVRVRIDAAFTRLQGALDSGCDVVIPIDGIGTGLAQLPSRAPAVHDYIVQRLANLGGDDRE